MISVIIPVRNGARTLDRCLSAACAPAGPADEVIVVDDASTDGSGAIAARHRCRVVSLGRRRGAGAARNAGAAAARGETLFFTDADCIVGPQALRRASATLAGAGPRSIVGGTYECRPHDSGFFPMFQAAFVNYHETRRPQRPDYVATHAMAVRSADFRQCGGFAEQFLPILEDVEFCHRVRRAGYRLLMDPQLLVRHDFGFGLLGSLRNAARKARHWTRYSARNRDLLADSGTASRGLKSACVLAWLCWTGVGVGVLLGQPALALAAPLLLPGALAANAGLVRTFHRAGGGLFAAGAAAYLLLGYPVAIAAGASLGLADLVLEPRRG